LFNPYDISLISARNFLRSNAVLEMADTIITKPKGSATILLYQLADKNIFSKNNADWFVANIK